MRPRHEIEIFLDYSEARYLLKMLGYAEQYWNLRFKFAEEYFAAVLRTINGR